MKRALRSPWLPLLALAAILAVLAAGCDRDSDGDSVEPTDNRVREAQQAKEKAQQEMKQAQAERELAEVETRRWRTITAWTSAGAVLMLVAGTALGSAARRHAHGPQ